MSDHRPYHHGNLKVALIEAAAKIIREESASALTLRGVANVVGVSHAAPYRHFDDKASLLAAVAAQGIHLMTDSMEAAVATIKAPGPLDRYQEIGIAYVIYAWNHPEHYRVMFDDEVSDRAAFPAVHEAKERCYNLLKQAIVDGQADGTVRERNPDEFALLSWSLVHGLSALILSGLADVASEDEARALARNLTNGAYLGQMPRDR